MCDVSAPYFTDKGNRVFVHCMHGKNRSVAATVAFLVVHRGQGALHSCSLLSSTEAVFLRQPHLKPPLKDTLKASSSASS